LFGIWFYISVLCVCVPCSSSFLISHSFEQLPNLGHMGLYFPIQIRPASTKTILKFVVVKLPIAESAPCSGDHVLINYEQLLDCPYVTKNHTDMLPQHIPNIVITQVSLFEIKTDISHNSNHKLVYL